MQRVAGTILFGGLLLGALAALIVLVAQDPGPRTLVAILSLSLGFGLSLLLSRPHIASHRVPEKLGVAGMAVLILVVVSANDAPDIVWVVFVGLALGLIAPTILRILRREWSRDVIDSSASDPNR